MALVAACSFAVATAVFAQEITVSGKVALDGAATASPPASVVWLAPVGSAANSTPVTPMHVTLTQKNKMFEPHLLVITRGSVVDFPNRDPWFHNVFSLFNGKRFDLGLYEAGSSRMVHFDREGVSFIFCNIHPEMSAVVVVLGSPYFAVTDKQGGYSISGVPAGRYMLHVWNESAVPASLQALTRPVEITDTARTVGTLRVPITQSASLAHKNKYGQEYEPPSPNNPIYAQP